MKQKSNGKIFYFKNKFLNFSETKNFSTESLLTIREVQPLVSYKRVSCKKKYVYCSVDEIQNTKKMNTRESKERKFEK